MPGIHHSLKTAAAGACLVALVVLCSIAFIVARIRKKHKLMDSEKNAPYYPAISTEP